MNSKNPVIGELDLPLLLILPTNESEDSMLQSTEYAWIHSTKFKHTFKSTLHSLYSL